MGEVSDAELERLALAADPDVVPDADAVPFDAGELGADLLPEWYMPVPRGGGLRGPKRVGVFAMLAALLVVNGAGLCVTYGFPEIAW